MKSGNIIFYDDKDDVVTSRVYKSTTQLKEFIEKNQHRCFYYQISPDCNPEKVRENGTNSVKVPKYKRRNGKYTKTYSFGT